MSNLGTAGLVMMIAGVVLVFASTHLSVFAVILTREEVIHPVAGTAAGVALFALGNLLFTRG